MQKKCSSWYYICSANADIQPVEPKTSGTLRRFEDIKDCYREIRRGHWHTYWTGKKDGSEKRKLILKWIPFTYVNVEKSEELPIVVNVVKNQ